MWCKLVELIPLGSEMPRLEYRKKSFFLLSFFIERNVSASRETGGNIGTLVTSVYL